MNPDIEARLDGYGRLVLTCNEREYARLRDLVCEEAAVRPIIDALPGDKTIGVVVIAASVGGEQLRKVPRWLELVPCLLAGCVSGVATIVGFVVITQWIMRQLA